MTVRIVAIVLTFSLVFVIPAATFADNLLFTPEGATGVWDAPENRTPEEIPDDDDNATIPNGKTCLIESADAEEIIQLLVEDGGAIEIDGTLDATGVMEIEANASMEVSGTIDVTEKLTIREDGDVTVPTGGTLVLHEDDFAVTGLEIESDGQLHISGTVELYNKATIDGTVEFSGVTGELKLEDTLTISGSGSIFGLSVGTSAVIRGADNTVVTISGDLVVKNDIRIIADEFVNNATLLADRFNSNLSLVGGEFSGSGLYRCTNGSFTIDPGGVLAGSGGTWELDGTNALLRFWGQVNQFRDTLNLKRGTFQVAVGSESELREDFQHCGEYTLGGHESDDLVIEVDEGFKLEVGLPDNGQCP